MISHATVFIGAGSETTAGVLTAVTSFLLENPDKLERLKREVRSAFKSRAEISLDAVNNQLPFLVACTDEALRLYPQTGVPSLRISGDNDVICGIPVPPKVRIAPSAGISNITLHADMNFPRRWWGYGCGPCTGTRNCLPTRMNSTPKDSSVTLSMPKMTGTHSNHFSLAREIVWEGGKFVLHRTQTICISTAL